MGTLHTWVTRGATVALVGVIGLIVLLTFFLYRSYYHSITFTQRIVDLRSTIALIELDETRAKKVTEYLTWRSALPPLDPKKINNPFR